MQSQHQSGDQTETCTPRYRRRTNAISCIMECEGYRTTKVHNENRFTLSTPQTPTCSVVQLRQAHGRQIGVHSTLCSEERFAVSPSQHQASQEHAFNFYWYDCPCTIEDLNTPVSQRDIFFQIQFYSYKNLWTFTRHQVSESRQQISWEISESNAQAHATIKKENHQIYTYIHVLHILVLRCWHQFWQRP